MIRWTVLLALAAIGMAATANAADGTMATMRGHRRVLLIAAPDRQNDGAVRQRRILDSWRRQAADRDISLVEVTPARVTGSADDAAFLRKRYDLQQGRFEVLLIGKDGNVAFRSGRPVTAERLQAIIDAMPMRRAGER